MSPASPGRFDYHVSHAAWPGERIEAYAERRRLRKAIGVIDGRESSCFSPGGMTNLRYASVPFFDICWRGHHGASTTTCVVDIGRHDMPRLCRSDAFH